MRLKLLQRLLSLRFGQIEILHGKIGKRNIKEQQQEGADFHAAKVIGPANINYSEG